MKKNPPRCASCGALIPKGRSFCKRHWFMLTPDMRDGILAAAPTEKFSNLRVAVTFVKHLEEKRQQQQGRLL